MKGFLRSTLVGLVICALGAVSAFAGSKDKKKVRKESVTFASDVMVNGTLVKAGDYELKFDEQTGELVILKGGKVKAKATAHSTQRSDKARDTAVRTVAKGNVAELIGVTFQGSNQDLVVGAGSGAVTGNQ